MLAFEGCEAQLVSTVLSTLVVGFLNQAEHKAA